MNDIDVVTCCECGAETLLVAEAVVSGGRFYCQPCWEEDAESFI